MHISRRTFGTAVLASLVMSRGVRAFAAPTATGPAESKAQPKEISLDLGNGVVMAFALIPAGRFLMGSGRGDVDEKPVHGVVISRAFYMAKTTVTREQWQAVLNPDGDKDTGKHPIDKVSCWDCQQFIRKLGDKIGRDRRTTLPTEAQWEYACRAGTNTEFCFGDDEEELNAYGWSAANAGKGSHPVAQKKPNAWGLFDMHGNVFEWCSDWGGKYPADDVKDVKDPTGPARGETGVMRGGSWKAPPASCRSSFRRYGDPAARISDVGFRLVLDTQ